MLLGNIDTSIPIKKTRENEQLHPNSSNNSFKKISSNAIK